MASWVYRHAEAGFKPLESISTLTIFRFLTAGLLWLNLGLFPLHAQEYDEDELPFVEILEVRDFAELAKEADADRKIILLEMSASYCGYCRTLEEEIIKPMLRSGDYSEHVLIRKLEIDSHYPMQNLNGTSTSPASLSNEYDIFVTPTLLFLDGQGKEVSERILGVNSLDFYGAYVDEALDQGYRTIQNR